jgi:hypothetical protein
MIAAVLVLAIPRVARPVRVFPVALAIPLAFPTGARVIFTFLVVIRLRDRGGFVPIALRIIPALHATRVQGEGRQHGHTGEGQQTGD